VSLDAFRELEPYEVKVSRTVLRGERGRKPPDLPDQIYLSKLFENTIFETPSFM
jgi:hypothetical protein